MSATASVSGETTTASSEGLGVLDSIGLERYEETCKKVEAKMTESLIFINTTTQRLRLRHQSNLRRVYTISTAKNGVGQEEGSGKTPLGLHFVQEKIGDGANPFAVFESRQPTGEIAKRNEGKMGIVGRILRLGGLEPSFNQGKNTEEKVVDSFERYIYIHGTNDCQNVGEAVSGGCVRMLPEDVVSLYDKVSVGTHVFIY